MNTMRNFSWKYFTLTGDVESFLLYREVEQLKLADRLEAVAITDGEDFAEEAASGEK